MDTYKTIISAVEDVIFKEKGSKFIAYALPVTNEIEIKHHLERIKKEHFSARHWCYAWQIGKEKKQYRANDDGEPNGTAGLPIFGQIQSFNLTNVLVVVVRYFGGVKLGVSGLINAYKTSAQMVLQNTEIQTFTIDLDFEISFEYKDMNKVMRVLKEKNISVKNQILQEDCKIYIEVRKSEVERISQIFSTMYGVSFKEIV